MLKAIKDYISDYITGPTHRWWVDNVWRPSWTKFVSLVAGIPAFIVAGLEIVSRWANDTTIATYLAQVGVPNWVPSAIAGVALIYYIASGRK